MPFRDATAKEAGSGYRAGGRRGVKARETHPFFGELIQTRR